MLLCLRSDIIIFGHVKLFSYLLTYLLLRMSEGIHDEGTMKSESSDFCRYELCVMAKFFNFRFIARWGQ